MTRFVVGVGGLDGSGKSRFAARLVEELHRQQTPAVLMHVDDFRRPVDWKDGDGVSEADRYYRDYYDLALLDACLQRFLGGADAVVVPRWDPAREQLHGTTPISFGEAPVLVVEGVFLRRVPTLAAGLGLWLRTTVTEAVRRVIERDTGRGRALSEVRRRLDQRYLPSHERYIAEHDPEGNAQIVVENECFDAPRVDRVDPGLAGSPLAHALQSLLESCQSRRPSSSMQPASTPREQSSASRG